MSDEGMDPCECIWSHELSMRRLLSLVNYCDKNPTHISQVNFVLAETYSSILYRHRMHRQ